MQGLVSIERDSRNSLTADVGESVMSTSHTFLSISIPNAIFPFLQSIDDLRTRGATIRHARGFNTCVRCLNHFQPSNSSLVSEDCMVHVQELNMFDNGNEIIKSYPCCKGSPESMGCVPAAHLPMFQMTDGKVNPERRVEHDPNMDLKSGT